MEEHEADASAPRRRGGPVRTGLTPLDLLAALTPLACAFAARIAPVLAEAHVSASGEVFIHDVRGLAVSVPLAMAWFGLPVGVLMHHLWSRGRSAAAPVSVPVVRVAWALALVAAVLVLGDAARGQGGTEVPRRYADYLPDLDGRGGPLWLAHDRMMVALGLAVAVFGASTQRGAHRRLFDAALQRKLAGVAAALALVAASSGAYGAVTAPSEGAAPHLSLVAARPLLLQLPLVLGAAFAATAALRQNHRAAAFALGAAASLTLAARCVLAPFEGPLGAFDVTALMAVAAVGLISTAGAAEPLPRDPG